MLLRKKTIGAAFLVLALLCPLVAVPGQAAAPMAVTVSAPAALPDVGRSFQVTVSVAGNTGFHAVQLKLAYDEAVVACTDVALGDVLKGTLSATNPRAARGQVGAMVAAASTERIDRDGSLAVFTFRVVQQGKPGFRLLEDEFSAADGSAIAHTVAMSGQGTAAPTVPDETGSAPSQTSGTPFTDVPETFWAAKDIRQAAERKLVAGYTDGSFRPERNVTRAEFVTMLWRLSGSPTVAGQTGFADVPDESWFAGQVAWAAQQGYVKGKSAVSFDPNGAVTRQEAMTILFRYSGGQSGGELMLTSIYDAQFSDSGALAAWAKPAMYWAVYRGLITGVTPETLVPAGNATRAQIAVILVRYANDMIED